MENKILNKHFFIKKNNSIYCGKCGKKQLQDVYNLMKHANQCGFPTPKIPFVFDDGKDYAYAFKISKDSRRLLFYVFSYHLKPMPGFKDKYSGGEWKNDYCTSISMDGEIKEKGLYNIDIWLKHAIDQKHIPSLSSSDDVSILHSFFSDILSVESFGAFIDIYRNKGYGDKIYGEEDMEKIRKALGENENPELLTLKYTDEISCITASIRNEDILEMNDGSIVICVRIFAGLSRVSIAVSDGFAYCKSDCTNIIPALLYAKNIKSVIDNTAIERFDTAYPAFMLKRYLNSGGKNICIPLFASNYNKCMELLYKAGISTLADNFRNIKNHNTLPLYKNNLKEIFGFPVKTLKRIASEHITLEENIFQLLADIYKENPRFLSFDYYSTAALQCFKYQNVTHKHNFRYDSYHTIKLMKTWSEEDMIHTIKYLNKIDDGRNAAPGLISKINYWDIYKDYLNMCEKLQFFVKGKWPKNLMEAHDLAAELYFAKQNEIQEREFKEFIDSEFYQSFTTGYEDGKELFENDEYVIITPEKAYDLVKESSQMNNCVKTYIPRVCDQQTMIYFLRKKKDIGKSVCTIEMTPNKVLRQLKAYGNSKANKEIQDFIRKWAKIKKVTISTMDMMVG